MRNLPFFKSTYPNYPAEDIVEYIVAPVERKQFFDTVKFSFTNRQQAREFKRLLKESKQAVKAQILKREYINGNIADTKVS